MNYPRVSSTGSLAALTIIKIILVIVLFVNYFFTIKIIQEIQLYLMIYLAYLLIIPPIINYYHDQKIEKFEQPLRKKFVTAKEELDKAVDLAADSPEDAMMYLRTAIDLSIKRKFGFIKISKMYNFIQDAENFNLPLPSYAIIYTIFNEGSKRIHDGKIPTPFEASQSIELVTNFISELEKTDVSLDVINKFKNKCKFVS